MIDKVLMYDCETNGTDPAVHQIVEAAGVLWSVKHASTVAGFSFVVQAPSNDAERINGIPPGLLTDHGLPHVDAVARVAAWMSRADYVIAHNAAFDAGFLPKSVELSRPWICSQDDIDWPVPSTSQKLTDICLAHGLGISHAHRALVDVMNLARLFERCKDLGHPPADLLARALVPKARYVAITGRYDPAVNERLKQAAFRWEPGRKQWWRKLRDDDVERLATQLGLRLVREDAQDRVARRVAAGPEGRHLPPRKTRGRR